MLQCLTLQLNWERTQLRVSVPVLRWGLRKPFPVQPQAGLSYFWSHNFHLDIFPVSLSLSWKMFPPRLFFCQTASCLYLDQGAAKNTISSSGLSFRLSLLFLAQISSTPSYHTALDCLFVSSTKLSSWGEWTILYSPFCLWHLTLSMEQNRGLFTKYLMFKSLAGWMGKWVNAFWLCWVIFKRQWVKCQSWQTFLLFTSSWYCFQIQPFWCGNASRSD